MITFIGLLSISWDRRAIVMVSNSFLLIFHSSGCSSDIRVPEQIWGAKWPDPRYGKNSEQRKKKQGRCMQRCEY